MHYATEVSIRVNSRHCPEPATEYPYHEEYSEHIPCTVEYSIPPTDEGVSVNASEPHDPASAGVPIPARGAGFPEHAWRRPSACGPNSGNCVEVNLGAGGLVGVRDSKIDGSPVLVFDHAEWTGFLDAVRRGEFDC